MSLEDVLDEVSLRELAGERSYERGEAYFENGCVGPVSVRGGAIKASVEGSDTYRVRIWLEDGELEYQCTCPIGQDEAFCKHCVAVGLAWLEEQASNGEANTSTAEDKIQRYLEGLDRDALIAMILDQADEDEELSRRLLMSAVEASGDFDIDMYRKALKEAMRTGRFVDYREAYGYSEGILEVVEQIVRLPERGRAAEAVELCEYALNLFEGAVESVEDSDGYMSDVSSRLEEVHLLACKALKPDPAALAKRLFEWEMRSDWGIFSDAVESYEEVLGDVGVAEYRRLAEAEWARFPALNPGSKSADSSGKRSRISGIMERLAHLSNDFDTLIAVKANDLSSPSCFLQIAQTCREAGKIDLSIEWAEKGLKSFPGSFDDRLNGFLADMFLEVGRTDEATLLIWADFERHQDLRSYQRLCHAAERDGSWPVWREKALQSIRASVELNKKTHRGGSFFAPDHSELVEIFLWEGHVEKAWAEAKAGNCSNHLWLKLAGLREREHPEDAIPIFQAQIGPTLEQKNNQAYEQAIVYLQHVQELMKQCGREAEFKPLLTTVRVRHKPKRNFMKLLDEARFG